MLKRIQLVLRDLLALAILLASSGAWAQLAPGSMDVHWDEGASNCGSSSHPPLQVHPYNERSFILRENPCATFEAPFMYLLIGSEKALLIDTGDVADPNQMPLANTVMRLLPGEGPAKMRLLVVHTHRHGDHRAGDEQFTPFSNAQVVGFDIDSIRRFYHFTDWPNGLAQIDLGERTVDVMQAKGQFLPCQYLVSSAKSGGSYAAHNQEPVLKQVGSASIEQRAEIETERMSREDVANELVRDVFPLSPRKLATFEYFLKISVLLDNFGALGLKISLGKFRLKKYTPELHINFGPLHRFAE